jgi:serine/threonine-protein kinase RsbW
MNTAPNSYHITFPAKAEMLEAMMSWIRAHAMEARLNQPESRKLELSLEEVLVNIIRYAYKDTKGKIELTCSIYPEERIEFIVKDKGIAFNPLMQDVEVPFEASLEERKEGGLGILLLRKYMDEIHYERQSSYNILVLTKKISRFSQTS